MLQVKKKGGSATNGDLPISSANTTRHIRIRVSRSVNGKRSDLEKSEEVVFGDYQKHFSALSGTIQYLKVSDSNPTGKLLSAEHHPRDKEGGADSVHKIVSMQHPTAAANARMKATSILYLAYHTTAMTAAIKPPDSASSIPRVEQRRGSRCAASDTYTPPSHTVAKSKIDTQSTHSTRLMGAGGAAKTQPIQQPVPKLRAR